MDMKTALDFMPDVLHVGGSKYKVILTDAAWNASTESHGMVETSEMTVYLCVAQTPTEFLNTLLHELSHVVWREWNLPSRPREERAVTAMGYGWAAIYRQNPELVEVISVLSTCD